MTVLKINPGAIEKAIKMEIYFNGSASDYGTYTLASFPISLIDPNRAAFLSGKDKECVLYGRGRLECVVVVSGSAQWLILFRLLNTRFL